MRATGNRLLPLLAGIVLLMGAFVVLRSCSGESGSSLTLKAVPQAPAPDADTPADTIKTLTASVAAMTSEVEALRRDNAQLRNENRALLASRAQIEENVATRVKRELLAREHDGQARERADAGAMASLSARVDALAESLSRSKAPGAASDIPVGLGLDGLGTAASPAERLLWVEPLDAPEADAGKPGLLGKAWQASGAAWATTRESAGNTVEAAQTRAAAVTPRPVYTVPRNATLIGSTAMTALVGRVPVHGQVRDPMPFKVITGADNLAANGLTVPGVAGMVWSGTAVGDWTLACVTGRLEAVTFVFEDGTIRTLAAEDREGGSGGKDRPLGWISDAQGIPCVSGERKTNAPAFLTQRVGVMAIQAAAQAAAAAETTTVVSDAGAVTGRVTGDTGAYVLGKTAAGGADEVAKWLAERASQSFDAVFVPAGVKLAIHVDREFAIDFHPSGRRLSHGYALDPQRRARLD
jgi:integrating conjugative element protein (TIGR03752 family)